MPSHRLQGVARSIDWRKKTCPLSAGGTPVLRERFAGQLVWPAVLVFCVWLLSASINFAGADEPVDYLRDVKPLLQAKCFSCHSARKQEGGLRLDAAALIRRGGDDGPAITPRSAKNSLLLKRVIAADDERMPPADSGTRLKADEIATLTAWINSGAVAPKESIPAAPSEHWSFQPPVQATPPNGSASWIRNDIDRFIAAEHRRLGVTPVGEVSRSMLLRRVSLDLIGLPPTRKELQTFLDDKSPAAFERAVDRLLASPRYGERWARHFMDVWRYSDPSGYGKEIRDGRQHIWRWRDWIVESLNAGKGYDRMVVEMLAADEVSPEDQDALRATGFLARNWYKFNRNVWLDNIVEHSSKAFVGLTVNCARCHEHKYDPIEQTSYYRMRAIFETHDVRDDPLNNGSAQLVRTFDAHLTRETFLFHKGDAKRPDKSRKLTPGLPDLFGELSVKPVQLPLAAWYPALREEARKAALAASESKIVAADEALRKARLAAKEARDKLAKYEDARPKPSQKPKKPVTAAKSNPAKVTAERVVLKDDFSKLNPDLWRPESGQWTAKDGRVMQSLGETKQHRLVSAADHPRDFRANLRLRITGGDQYQSVGFGFDVQSGAMNAIYLSTSGTKVQFSSQGTDRRWQYPAAGMASHPVVLGKDYDISIVVKGQLLNVAIDGKHKVAFHLPTKRQAGKLSVWTFSATAEFDNLVVTALAPNAILKPAGKTSPAQLPAKPKTKRDFELAQKVADAAVTLAEATRQVAVSERESLTTRTAAELVKYGPDQGTLKTLATIAGGADRQLAVNRLEAQMTQTNLNLLKGQQTPPTNPKAIQAMKKSQAQLAAQRKQLAAAKSQLDNGSDKYATIGATFPRTSSGRRLAFARWITNRKNPLSARVLVNHVWLRHFDVPLVERMFDFGLRSDKPRHLALLDWLAVRFMEDGWSLKKLHKQIVMSGVYRLSSSPTTASAETRKLDSDNHTLWRMNARRMEAEVVRDSLLYLGGSLDLTVGGPPVEHTRGQEVLRRSLYFRQDKERQMTFLSLFDGAKVNECYQRKATVAPQQALAMFNSRIASQQAKKLTDAYESLKTGNYVSALFDHVLCRKPSSKELAECTKFLSEFADNAKSRHQLALVLLNHNDFVTIR